MARRRNVYSKRRRINYIPIMLLAVILILVILFIYAIRMFRSNDFISQVEEIISSDILKTSGTLSMTSSIDTQVYTNDGLKYTNQHDNIKKLVSFDSSIPDDNDKILAVKALLSNLGDLEKDNKVKELSYLEDGYYWIDIDLTVEENKLLSDSEKEFNIDLYYSIPEEKIYVKEKYYDEFSTKNNKVKLQGYKADESYKEYIDELIVTNQ